MLVIRNSATRTSSIPASSARSSPTKPARSSPSSCGIAFARSTSSAPLDTAVVLSGWIRLPLKSAVRSGVAS
jgi:hypothetical protein